MDTVLCNGNHKNDRMENEKIKLKEDSLDM